MKQDLKLFLFYLMSGGLIMILARQFFIELSNIYFVEPLMSKIDKSLPNDFLVIILGILLLYFLTIFISVKKIVNPKLKISVITLTIFYLLIRNSNIWTFEYFTFNNSFYYSDIFLILPIWIIVRELLNPRNSKGNSKQNDISLLIEDVPTNIDTLGYKSTAQKIIDKLMKSHFQRSFAIGINSNWGNGKTTMLNLIKAEIDEKYIDPIVIDFKPWNSNNSNEIRRNFFELLGDKLSEYHFSAKKEVREYYKSLGGYGSGFFIDSLNNFFKKNEVKTQELADEIDVIITDIDKQIFIFIDDLDRLQKDEIIETLKIIRNTGDFRNIVYFVAYDKQYLNTAIKQINDHNFKSFLEKIIQIEISLPYYEKRILADYFLREFLSRLDNDQVIQEIKDFIEQDGLIPFDSFLNDETYIDDKVNNFRQVNKLINSLIIDFDENIQSEIVFSDFFQLQLIKLEFPHVFDFIKNNLSHFFSSSAGVVHLRTPFYIPTEHQEIPKSNIETKLKATQRSLHLSDIEFEHILSQLTSLFPENNNLDNELSVRNPLKISMYFKSYFDDKILSEKEFLKARQEGCEGLRVFIDESFSKGKQDELFKKLSKVRLFKNVEDAEAVLKSIFYMDSLYQEHEYNRYTTWEVADVMSILSEINSSYKDQFNGLFKRVFKQAEPPFILASEVIFTLAKEHEVRIPIEKGELHDVNNNYFGEYLQLAPKLNSFVWRLFWNCHFYFLEEVDGGGYASTERVDEHIVNSFKDFLKNKDTITFVESVINEPFRVENRYIIDHDVLKHFESKEELAEFILDSKKLSEDEKEEFKKFYDKYISENRAIPFDFEYFNIKRKWKVYST